MESEVKKSYEKINISDSVQKRIKQSILSDNTKSKSKSVLSMSRAKVAIVACLSLAMIVPTGTYAAQKIYQYFKTTVQRSSEYNVDVKLNKTESNEKASISDTAKQQYIKLVYDFGPEYSLEKKHDAMMCYEHKDGFESGKSFWYKLLYLDGNMEETISNYDIAINETLTIKGRKAVYSGRNSIVGTRYKNENRYKTEYGQVLYIFLEDSGYILEIVAQNGLDKEKMIYLAEGVDVQLVNSKNEASMYILFSEDQDGAWSEKVDDDVQPKEIMNYFRKETKLNGTTYKVKDVQVLDNINGLDRSGFIDNQFKMDSLVTKGGKLIKYNRELLKFGDGITEPERKVVKTEKIQSKLVYVTLELENSAANSVDGNFYIPSLQFVTKKAGKIYEMYYRDNYSRPEVVDDACIDYEPCYIEENLGGKESWAVKASKASQTIHIAYLVDEDFVDDISLWLNDYSDSNHEKCCLEILK